jgi:hypothetical protein
MAQIACGVRPERTSSHMATNITEFPKHPQPQVPDMPQTPSRLLTPMVYERVEWEYKVVEKKLVDGPLKGDELCALGRQRWELIGILSVGDTAQFYFKRVLE